MKLRRSSISARLRRALTSVVSWQNLKRATAHSWSSLLMKVDSLHRGIREAAHATLKKVGDSGPCRIGGEISDKVNRQLVLMVDAPQSIRRLREDCLMIGTNHTLKRGNRVSPANPIVLCLTGRQFPAEEPRPLQNRSNLRWSCHPGHDYALSRVLPGQLQCLLTFPTASMQATHHRAIVGANSRRFCRINQEVKGKWCAVYTVQRQSRRPAAPSRSPRSPHNKGEGRPGAGGTCLPKV